jgi:hypothetical protein
MFCYCGHGTDLLFLFNQSIWNSVFSNVVGNFIVSIHIINCTIHCILNFEQLMISDLNT